MFATQLSLKITSDIEHGTGFQMLEKWCYYLYDKERPHDKFKESKGF